MEIIRAGTRRYIWWTPEPATSDQLEVSVDGKVTWQNLLVGVEDPVSGRFTVDVAGTSHAALFASPTSPQPDPAGTISPGVGRHIAYIRYSSNPEVEIETGGLIEVQ